MPACVRAGWCICVRECVCACVHAFVCVHPCLCAWVSVLVFVVRKCVRAFVRLCWSV